MDRSKSQSRSNWCEVMVERKREQGAEVVGGLAATL